MRIPLFKRLVITLLNIIFPPLAVIMITGPNADFLFNCVMFLLAVIPSHIHGFYVSLTYFNRKRKVRKGVYPGKRHHLIWSDKVNNGGASAREIERLRREKEGGKRPGIASKLGVSRGNGNGPVQDWDDGYKEHGYGYGNGAGTSPTVSNGTGSWRSGRRHNRQRRRLHRHDDEYSDY